MEEQIRQLEQQFETDLEAAKKNGDFDTLYLKYFSKKNGLTSEFLKQIANLDPEKKRTIGPLLNDMQIRQKSAIELARKEFVEKTLENPLIDLTMPQPATNTGFEHPTNQVIKQMNDFFRYHGFSVYDGPEIETAEYNFRKLNLPKGHPATDLQDTLYVNEGDTDQSSILLRTHTSSVEARVLTLYEPPLRLVISGKVYRNETPNATNGAFFHQYQGVVVDKGITIQNLKYILEKFHKHLFGEDTELRWRYKYYPEVSPGLGVDMKCKFCDGDGCTVCKQRGYIEVLGSGMIHYNTLKMCGINPDIYTGFAFGVGLDRLVMQKFEVSDIRTLYGGGIVYV